MNQGSAPIWLGIGLVVIIGGTIGWYAMQLPASTAPSVTTVTPSQLNTDIKRETSAPEKLIAKPISTTKTYTSLDNVLNFDYPTNIAVAEITKSELPTPWGTSVVTYPTGSVEVPGLFVVSRVPYTDFSREKPIYDYQSCCTGIRYWYDAAKNAWQANKILATEYDANNKPIAKPEESAPLLADDKCTVAVAYGSHTFYKIKSGDEGVPTDTYYFILTDQGYAFRFLSLFDLEYDYSKSAPTVRPDPKQVDVAKQLLSSVALSGLASEITADCL